MGKASRKKTILHDKRYQDETVSNSPIKSGVGKDFRKPAKITTPLLLIVIILAASFTVYFNTLSNNFVYDDMTQVLENPWIRDMKHLPDIFSKSVWSFRYEHTISNYYRPLMHFIYMINYYVFGLTPWGFHLVNVLFHAANSVMVFIITVRLLGEHMIQRTPASAVKSNTPLSSLKFSGVERGVMSIPFIASLLFAVHPIHTEAVAWVAGLPDLSFAFFYLLSLYLYISSTEEKQVNKLVYALSIASFFLAALCKEPALTLPVILIVYDYVVRKNNGSFFVHFKRYVPYFAVIALYLILRFYALGGFAPEKRHAYLNAYQYVINVFPLFAQYLEKLFLPVNLNAFYVLHPIFSLTDMRGIITAIITAAFFFAAFILSRKNSMLLFSLFLIVFPLLPALYIPGLGENTFAERYLYLPSLGFVLIVSYAITWIRKTSVGTSVAVSLLVVIAGLYVLGTVTRNYVWRSDFSLFSDTVKKSPDSALPRRMLGTARLDMGMSAEAVADFNKAITIDPSDFYSYNNRGMAFYQMGLLARAMADFDRATALNPRCYEAYINKGRLYGETGFPEKAIGQFSKAIEIAPESLAYSNRGLAYSLVGEYGKALEDLNRAIELDKNYTEAYGTRGNLYLKTGSMERAVSDFRRACDLGDNNACEALRAVGKI